MSVFKAFQPIMFTFSSFPLDRCRWFRSDVVADAVDVVNFIDDADRNLIQHLVRDACPVGSHKVGGGNTAQCEGIVIGSEVAHDADRTHIGQNRKILVDGFIQTCFGNLIAEDEICFAQDVQLFFGNLADDADGKTWTRERLAVDQIIRQTQLSAQCADLVLEQQAQRLDDFLEVDIVRQTADIVVRFDDSSITGAGFYNVSIDGALCQKVDLANLFGFFLKYADKFPRR